MSDFQSCPGCASLILSDTPECPECGHVLDAESVVPAAKSTERGATMHQQCPKCGDEVPAGLVRCWSCNAFMRNDVAERYQSLVDNPQTITFSDIPPGERTETIPPRGHRDHGGYARILDADADEFTLQGEDPVGTDASPDFELSSGAPNPSQQEPERASESEPQESAATAETPEENNETSEQETSEAASQDTADTSSTSEKQSAPDANADDLLSIAMTQEKEADFRRKERLAAMNQKRILIPCPSCGVWLRVREEQSGRSVRCRNCQAGVPVPQIKKKQRRRKAKQQTTQVSLDWIEGVHLHLIAPTDVTLKPGSLKDTWLNADIAFHTDGIHLISLGEPPKKSLFSRSTDGDETARRSENQQALQKDGNFTKVPHGDVYSVPSENLAAIRLVQPVRQAHESMFAGVPVFGEGRVAIYLPLRLDEGKQAFCSLPLSLWRQFTFHLQQRFEMSLPDKENGVPQKDAHSSPLCHYTQAKVESIRDLVYYQNDSNYELELTGYRCTECGIAVSEDGRAKNKLGGKNGKSIAKAKCPKCEKKFGSELLYKITRAPEALEAEDDTASDNPAEAPAGESAAEVTT